MSAGGIVLRRLASGSLAIATPSPDGGEIAFVRERVSTNIENQIERLSDDGGIAYRPLASSRSRTRWTSSRRQLA
jgi:hypothetical protein